MPHPPSPEPQPTSPLALDRREFLLAGAAAIAAASSLPALAQPMAPAATAPQAAPSKARNLIFLVADGMSGGVIALCDLYCRNKFQRRSHWTRLMNHPGARRSLIDNAPARGLVPDSASSASAWGIGERVDVGAICFTPDGRSPAPLFLRAKQQGKAIGLVTTTRLTDATPAGFIANAPKRTMEAEIAEQILTRGVDVLLGGGSRFLTPALLSEHRIDCAAHDRASLLAAPIGPTLVGLFADDNMAFEIERPDSQPPLTEMLSAALARLAPRPEGFVLMLEGARVDHAAHANDAAALIHEQWAFEEAVAAAADFALSRNDTLLIVTTDHANANPGLANHAVESVQRFARLLACEHSFEWMLARLHARPKAEQTAAGFAEILTTASHITLSAPEIEVIDRWLKGRSVNPYDRANTVSSPLGSVLANHIGVAFTGPDHTSDYVECLALGPGSESLAPQSGIEKLHDLAATALGVPSK